MNIVITGGGSGLGRTIAALFLAQGHRVHVCDVAAVTTDGLAAAEGAFRSSVCNVGDRQSIDAFFGEVRAWMPSVEVLINNVGVAGPRAPFEDVDDAAWEDTLGANLLGAIRCIRHVLPGMKAARSGTILNISTSSVVTRPLNRSPYIVSKAALESLTMSLAREVGPDGIRCNAIRPGMMNNERMFRVLGRVAADSGKSVDEVLRGELQFISMRSMIPMDDVAALALYLCSDAARYITGQCMAVDGGSEWES